MEPVAALIVIIVIVIVTLNFTIEKLTPSRKYNLISGIDYPDNSNDKTATQRNKDISYWKGPFSECAATCDLDTNCVGYTLDKTVGANCWLRSSLKNPILNSSKDTYVIPNTTPCSSLCNKKLTASVKAGRGISNSAQQFGVCRNCPSKWFKSPPFQTSNDGITWITNKDVETTIQTITF